MKYVRQKIKKRYERMIVFKKGGIRLKAWKAMMKEKGA